MFCSPAHSSPMETFHKIPSPPSSMHTSTDSTSPTASFEEPMAGENRQFPKVVVVGGGIGGALLAKSIQNYTDVTLVDSKEYFEIPWANLRAKVEPAIAERSVFYHSDYLVKGKVVVSTAITVTQTDVLISDGRLLPYDYLVIATGHSYASPKSRKDRLEQFKLDCDKIGSSDSVLIIGGGPTGVELAGEIAVGYPDKKVTLVHNGPRLLEFIGPKAGHKALEWLTSKKVEVLLDQSIDLKRISDSDRVYHTSSGVTVTADCRFLCVGKPLGSSWLNGSWLKEYLDRNGRLMVDENFRVGGLRNVFAVGDITDVPEMKQGATAQKHSLVVAKNLKLLVKGGKETKLYRYKPSASLTMVSLGRKDCLAQYPMLTITGFLPAIVKSRDLFVGRTRKLLGLDSHPV